MSMQGQLTLFDYRYAIEERAAGRVGQLRFAGMARCPSAPHVHPDRYHPQSH